MTVQAVVLGFVRSWVQGLAQNTQRLCFWEFGLEVKQGPRARPCDFFGVM